MCGTTRQRRWKQNTMLCRQFCFARNFVVSGRTHTLIGNEELCRKGNTIKARESASPEVGRAGWERGGEGVNASGNLCLNPMQGYSSLLAGSVKETHTHTCTHTPRYIYMLTHPHTLSHTYIHVHMYTNTHNVFPLKFSNELPTHFFSRAFLFTEAVKKVEWCLSSSSKSFPCVSPCNKCTPNMRDHYEQQPEKQTSIAGMFSSWNTVTRAEKTNKKQRFSFQFWRREGVLGQMQRKERQKEGLTATCAPVAPSTEYESHS